MADLAILRRLRSPRGILELVAATFAVALALAIFASTQRDFFERYVKQKFAPVAPATRVLAERIEREQAQPSELDALSEAQWQALYELWLQDEAPEKNWARVPSTLCRKSPDFTGTLVERTLVAGTSPQQSTAVRFAATAGCAALKPALTLAQTRAVKRRETDKALELERVASRLGP